MIRTAPATAGAAGMLIAGAGAASADDRGNHMAIWKADQHTALTSGTDDRRNGRQRGLKASGVSEGVHLAKDNGPK